MIEIPAMMAQGKAHFLYPESAIECGLILAESVNWLTVTRNHLQFALHAERYGQACLTCLYIIANKRPAEWDAAKNEAWRVIDANRTRNREADDYPFGRCFGAIRGQNGRND